MRGLPAGSRLSLRHPAVVTAVAAVVCAVVAAAALLVTDDHSTAPADASTTTMHPLAVLSTTPASGTTGVAPDTSLSVTFSQSLPQFTVSPTLSPAISGSWSRTAPNTLTFTPAGSLPPGGTVTVTVPGGHQGVQAVDGATLPADVTDSFTVAGIDTLRLQQLLAQLGYLPVDFQPQNPAPIAASEEAIDQAGSFVWRWSTFPTTLTSQWTPGQFGVITKGAVMSFESNNNLAVDGVPGPQVWGALLTDVAQNATDPEGFYDWVDVSMNLPETVTVWRDGAVVYQTPANTGVPAAATTPGTYPVYARYQVTTMKGTNPDGTTYDDPGIPWVSYFDGGQALHGYVRASYGFPQSDGCVEMPPANAAVVWPMTPLGTLVTVE